ncbi:MAG: HAMP domain-containing sensor histidine kinase [Leptolyngbyaceae cyanobacterium bins.349]|nr:HAMP domain-containing sensor histidine kinase [Leptolyngbyaceae cyanobacterium bins.349]
MPVSSEFVALCQAQIMLLTQALGASISVVYLTQEQVQGAQPHLTPIATYPESFRDRDRPAAPLQLPAVSTATESNLDAPPDQNSLTQDIIDFQEKAATSAPAQDFVRPFNASSSHAETFPQRDDMLVEQRQIVLPLVFEEHVFGLLVTRRDDRAWETWERAQVEGVARTLALACVMDQRYQWSQHKQEQERLLQLQQHDLMDNLLHQFRNSLTALQTFGKLILRRLGAGDRSRELASSITRETERLRDLAQQMEIALETGFAEGTRSLPPSEVGAHLEEEQLGDAMLEPQPAALPPAIGLLRGGQLSIERCLVESILEPLVTSAQAIAQEKDLTLHTHLTNELPPVWANPKALREALNNLIENAIKYTPAKGQIWVMATAPDGAPQLEIAISDTGTGIPAEDLPHIFERHFRGVQAQGTIPGTGLGLAITRSLIEQMHGKIQVFSPALATKQQTPGLAEPDTFPLPPTPGATFVIQLPVALGE